MPVPTPTSHRSRPESPRLGPGYPPGGDRPVGQRGRVRLPRRVVRPADRRVHGRYRDAGLRASCRSTGRWRWRAPSRVGRSRSSCSPSSPRTGAGRPRSPASACWPTSSRTRSTRSPPCPPVRTGSSTGPASASRWPRSVARSGWRREPTLHHPARPSRREHGHPAPGGGHDPLPAGVRGRGQPVDGRRPRTQGDGEVCGTAIETPMRATVRVTARNDLHVSGRSSRPRPIRGPRSARDGATRPMASVRTS